MSGTTTRPLSCAPRRTPSALLRRLRNLEDDFAWDQFAKLYRDFVLQIARSGGLSPPDAAEVAQEVLLRVSRTIHHFERKPHVGAFRSWLRRLARWCTHDLRRRLFRLRLSGDIIPLDARALEAIPSSHPDPAAQFEAACRLKLVRMALRRLQRRFKPATLQIYQLYVVDGWEIGKITRFLQISRTQVYVAKSRVDPHLRREINLLESQISTRFLGKASTPCSPDPQVTREVIPVEGNAESPTQGPTR